MIFPKLPLPKSHWKLLVANGIRSIIFYSSEVCLFVTQTNVNIELVDRESCTLRRK